jgi:hypothetical protein
LEIVQQHVPLLTLLTPVPHNHATAVDNFSSIALTIEHAQPSPLAQHLSVRHLDEGNLVFRAKGDNEFLVCFFLAAFVQDTHMCLATVKGLASFPQATRETIMDKGEFEDACVRIDSQWTVKCKCARKAVGRIRLRYVIDWPDAKLVDGFLPSFSKRYESGRTFQSIEDGH